MTDRPLPSARDDLLDRIVASAAENGLSDVSLRDLGAAVGTSHRMVNYHFGSRAGLVAAVVGRIEAQQREALQAIAAEATSPSAIVAAQWEQLSDPAMAPFVRLFFEVVAAALFERPGTEGFLDGLTTPWLDVAGEIGERLGAGTDEADLRLGVAVMRGLLLDAVASGDSAAATASLNRFLRMWDADRQRS